MLKENGQNGRNGRVKGRKLFKKVLRILSYFRSYWKLWIFLFLISILLSALNLVNPLIVKFLIDDVLLDKNLELLKFLMLIFIGLTFVAVGTRVVSNYFYEKLRLNVLYDVRNHLFEHLEKLHLGFFHKKKMGDILSRLQVDIAGIEDFIYLTFNRLLMDILRLIFIFLICLYLNWQLTLITMTVVPFYVISQHYWAKKLRKVYRASRRKSADLLSFMEEKLSGISLVKAFCREEDEQKNQQKKGRELIKLRLEAVLLSSFAGVVIGFLTFAAMLFVLWYGGYQVIIGVMTLGVLVAIYTYLGNLFSPIESIAGFYTGVQSSLVSVDRVFSFLNVKTKEIEKRGAVKLPKLKGRVEFKNVYFNYGGKAKKHVLKNINFKVEPGETVGLVGGSGCGKTTLINLIYRISDPVEGNIFIDGFDTRDVTLNSLRKQIALAGQHTILFNTSVKENISYARPDASLARMRRAAKAAEIDSFIESLPQKYDTRIGEKGGILSGGQRQRVAVARTLLKDSRMLILDEATSSVESSTEYKIIRNVREMFKGRTIFIVAHRLAHLKGVDKILVMKKGRIVESGKFTELLRKKGEFHRLYNYQKRKSKKEVKCVS